MNNKIINAAIQILPLNNIYGNATAIIHRAIKVIEKSGLNYRVCPFETVVEGRYDDIVMLVKHIHEECFRAGANDLICNIKIHSRLDADLAIVDKMDKYE